MTAKDFWEWVKEYGAEDYPIEVMRNEEKSHCFEITDEGKILIYTK